ncbi:CAP domain-containing protein [Nonomuraea sp. NPDC048882]|uniref:CAP domain-containing protein n=1 Tax=Nonomuraea sp. NPDC048882 TaxID=3154347 RepID=UPI0033FED674
MAGTGTTGTRPALPDATNGEFLLQALREANVHRAAHGAPPLAMDPLLVEYAKARAAALSRHEGLRAGHEGLRAGTGESVFWSQDEEMRGAADAVASWYDDRDERDERDRLLRPACTAMGAARVSGQGPKACETYIVFVYEPLGDDPPPA